jgi:hypothetical protein
MAGMLGPLSILAAFVAGWSATLAGHQPTVWLLNHLGFVANGPFSMRATAPLGVPQVWSTAFWGGLWGIALVFAAARQRLMPLVLFGIIFGAVAPTLVNWFISAPLHGQPIARGWDLRAMWISPTVNAVWGLGCALFWRGLAR